jgi:hypothetical protein
MPSPAANCPQSGSQPSSPGSSAPPRKTPASAALPAVPRATLTAALVAYVGNSRGRTD